MNDTAAIVLATANARYSHCAFGLKRLWAALGDQRRHARVVEFTLRQEAREIADTLLAMKPRVLGFGVYIWNVELLTRVIRIIRDAAPDIFLVLGGPEMVDPADAASLEADYVIIGEGEHSFASLAARLLADAPPAKKIIEAAPPNLDTLPEPYDAYTDEDIRHRVIYVESARGCPYRCAFCLSARDEQVRYFPLEPFLASMNRLLQRGARRFKFTDRTFNIKEERVLAVLDFFLRQPYPDMQLHFEIMPDRVSAGMFEKMAMFSPNALHLEVGIQSVSAQTQRNINRNQDVEAAMETIRRLRNHTGATLHADLIVGLPGDTKDVIGRGFDMLVAAQAQEIQVGLLKRLKGTAIAGELGRNIRFDARPPYEVLETPTLTSHDIRQFKRFSRYFDLYYNKRNFSETLPLLWESADRPFTAFSALADYVWEREQKTHHLPLVRLAEHLYRHLVAQSVRSPAVLARAIEGDFRRLKGRRDKLPFLSQ